MELRVTTKENVRITILLVIKSMPTSQEQLQGERKSKQEQRCPLSLFFYLHFLPNMCKCAHIYCFSTQQAHVPSTQQSSAPGPSSKQAPRASKPANRKKVSTSQNSPSTAPFYGRAKNRSQPMPNQSGFQWWLCDNN